MFDRTAATRQDAGVTERPTNGDDSHERGWRLWRQDDHGNEFPMSLFADRAEADAECARYNAQPHHQHYWVAEER